MDYARLYSETLVRKLEDKMVEVEKLNRHLAQDNAERKRVEEALRESEKNYRLSFTNVSDVIYSIDSDFRISSISPSVERILGYRVEEVINRPFPELNILTSESLERAAADAIRIFNGESIQAAVYEFIAKNGTRKYGEVSGSPLYRNGEIIGLISVARDITERKQLEVRERLAHEVLELLNRPEGALDTISDILLTVKKHLEFEAVGLRLQEGDDFPYYETNGFSEEFVLAERRLCAYDEAGNVLRDGEGRAVLECMCGNVLRGRTDAAQPFFTEGGSFWTNSTTDLLASTTEEERQARTRNRCHGEGYESVALIPLRTGEEIIGLLQLNDRRRDQFTLGMIHFFEGLGSSIGIALARKQAEEKLQHTLESLRNAVGAIVQVVASAAETRDPYTAGHQFRSADLARAIAGELELPRDKIDAIRMAGAIHDIGKIAVPAEILSKPTRLTKLEFALIQEHSRKGYEILKDVESPWPLAEIIHQHHERMDGSGYPRMLKGEEILMEARIIAVADVVESMSSHRPYRPALGIDAALAEIEKNSGTLYDAAAADACLRLLREKRYELP
ncbi:MAG: PAS domain S-box protein [Smithellaceae bacterium]|nr:PAS domain S-box protein [Smithellaceae bacterium]